MSTIIVCVSVSHGNTAQIAEAMADVLDARIAEPEQLDPDELARYDLVGFGSGIFNRKFHPRLVRFIQALSDHQGRRAFGFATSGLRPPMSSLRRLMESKNLAVIDEFASHGWDTYFPFKLFGGIRKGHPDADDLRAAQAFAQTLRSPTS